MKRWAIFFGLFLVIIVILADTRHLGDLGVIYNFPYGDKVGHFVLFGLLSLAVNLSVFEARPNTDRKRLAIVTSLILAFLIGLEEISQIWFPTRTADIFDWLASCFGVALFAWLALKFKTRPSLSK